MAQKNEQERQGLSRRTLLAGAAVGGAGLAASLVEPGAVAAASTIGGGNARPLVVEREPGVGIIFALEIQGVGTIGVFQECEGLSSENEVLEYRDGSDPTLIRKSPGQLKFADIRLSRPLTTNLQLAEWRRLVEDGQFDEARKSCSLVMYDQSGSPVARYELDQAWPSKIETGDLPSDSNEVVMETITLTCERVRRVSP